MFFGGLLPIGTPAPAFDMLDTGGRNVRLSDFVGRESVVLVFYPLNNTPVCTQQLCEFRDRYETLKKNGIAVLGISRSDIEANEVFARKNNLTFPVLFDPDFRYAKLYKATLIPKVINKRVVYGINRQGNIAFARHGKPPVEEVLAALKS